MRILTSGLVFFISTMVYQSALADLPLTVEDLITHKNKFKLITNVNYFNQSQRNLTGQGYSIIDLGNGRTINLPKPMSEGTSNTDSLIATMGLSYGLTEKWDVGIKSDGVYHQSRQGSLGVNSQTTDHHLKTFL